MDKWINTIILKETLYKLDYMNIETVYIKDYLRK